MIRPTDDPNQTDLVAGYILDDLSPEEMALLNEALAETPALAEEIASFGEAFSLLPYNLPLREPAASLKHKIISAANHPIAANNLESPPTNVVPIASPRRRSWQQWIPAIGTGIAAVAVAAFGLNQFQLAQQSQQQIVALGQQLEATNNELKRLRSELQADRGTLTLLSQPDTQMYPLIGITNPNSGRISTARLLARSGDRSVTLIAHDLPTLSNDRIYRLWAVATPTAAPMYCGQFRQNNGGTAQWVAPNIACTKNPTKLLITLDAPTDPTTSAGPLVMQSSI
jgi:Anti-sigma-K factor rskA